MIIFAVMKKYQYHIFSPYRVCPLGAHVDHQHGLVTGFAIDKGVDLWWTPSGSPCLGGEEDPLNPPVYGESHVHLESKTFEGTVDFDIDAPTLMKQGNWGDYARGAKFALQKRFKLQTGITGTIKGSLPVGGLSSSAAVLIAYVMAFAKANNVMAFAKANNITLAPFEVMKIASEAEREYIGLNNGLLDQACIALGKKNHLLMLDCESDEYRVIPKPAEMPDFELGIFFSGLTRSLISSDYNLRVTECKTAAWTVQAYENVPLKTHDKTFLRDVPESMFKRNRDKMPPRFARRAEHFYGEHKRVREGITAWESGNLEWFGSLVKSSCESSIHNYECGSPELIAIYEAMLTTDGIYGGRFSGAGFKGACIALVDPTKKEQIEKEITEKYLAKFPQYKNTFKVYFCKSDDGARFVDPSNSPV